MDGVRQLVDALSRDSSVSQNLRDDPAALASRFRFGAAGAAALQRADRFFESEKPIFDRPLAAVAPHSLAADMVFSGGQPATSGLAATPDTGTLLPGPPTEGYTITSSATATTTTPSAPAGPATPASPTVPALPQLPGVPSVPTAPSVPAIGPQPQPSLPTPVCGPQCHSAAITAMVANVAHVANVAITAIVASTSHPPGHRCRCGACGSG
jgi:hypothetical protein